LQQFRLTIHESKAQVRPVTEGFPFLRFRIYPTHRRLLRRKGVHFQRRMKKRIYSYSCGELSFDRLKASITGWINHVQYGDTWRLRKSILNQISIPVPVCEAKHAKRDDHLYQNL
jgi:hypothetical protein